jgi:hypothetical protein
VVWYARQDRNQSKRSTGHNIGRSTGNLIGGHPSHQTAAAAMGIVRSLVRQTDGSCSPMIKILWTPWTSPESPPKMGSLDDKTLCVHGVQMPQAMSHIYT